MLIIDSLGPHSTHHNISRTRVLRHETYTTILGLGYSYQTRVRVQVSNSAYIRSKTTPTKCKLRQSDMLSHEKTYGQLKYKSSSLETIPYSKQAIRILKKPEAEEKKCSFFISIFKICKLNVRKDHNQIGSSYPLPKKN